MRTHGFTLIELVIVLVIIGVLAVVAIPKFISLELDAKNTTLKGLGAAVESSSTLIYNKAYVKGVFKEQAAQVEVDGKLVSISYGYPNADLALWGDGYFKLDVNHFLHRKSSDDLAVLFYFKDEQPIPTSITDSCIVYYLAATSIAPARYEVNECVD